MWILTSKNVFSVIVVTTLMIITPQGNGGRHFGGALGTSSRLTIVTICSSFGRSLILICGPVLEPDEWQREHSLIFGSWRFFTGTSIADMHNQITLKPMLQTNQTELQQKPLSEHITNNDRKVSQHWAETECCLPFSCLESLVRPEYSLLAGAPQLYAKKSDCCVKNCYLTDLDF